MSTEHEPQIDPDVARLGVRLVAPREQHIAECVRACIVERVTIGRASEVVIARLELRYSDRPHLPVHRALIVLVIGGRTCSAMNIRSEALAAVGGALTELSRTIAFELAEHDRDQWRAGT